MLDAALVARLRDVVGPGGVLDRPEALLVYECDGYTLERARPEVVVLPRSTDEVARIVRLCHRHDVRFVPRGAGTGLSGGCLPIRAPVMICLSRMNRILEIDLANERGPFFCTPRYQPLHSLGIWTSHAEETVIAAGWRERVKEAAQRGHIRGGGGSQGKCGPVP